MELTYIEKNGKLYLENSYGVGIEKDKYEYLWSLSSVKDINSKNIKNTKNNIMKIIYEKRLGFIKISQDL